MAKTRLQKEETVSSLTDKFGRAKSVVFADYQGLTMKDLTNLRNKLFEVGAEFTITKNTLVKRALPSTDLSGPTATLLSFDDEISPIKLLVKALKDAGIGKVKSGFLGSEILDEQKIIQLSNLPTKDELRGKMVGVLVAPLQGMVGVLQGNLRNLVYALEQIKISKGGE